MKQRKTRQPVYDTTARNQQGLQRYMGMTQTEIKKLIAWWVERNSDALNQTTVTEVLALLQLALAEKIGKINAIKPK